MATGLDLDGGFWLWAARALSVAGILSVFGALLFRTAPAPGVMRRMDDGGRGFEAAWRRWFWLSWGLAMAMTLVWLLLEASAMAGAQGPAEAGPGEVAAALPTVIGQTRFGRILTLRLVVLATTGLVVGRRRLRLWGATTLAGLAVALQSGHSHAASMTAGPSLLLLCEIMHLLAASVWLGGLVPLLLLVRASPPALAAQAARRFSPVGALCVALLVVTASWQFRVLIGGLPGLIGTWYGRAALVKLGLFASLLLLAACNRFRLTPRLAGASPGRAKRLLAGSIALEAALGLLVILAAGLLSSLPPAMHLQPLWPFSQRPSLVTLAEDAQFRREAILACLALGIAALLLAAAALVRRRRWLPVIAAVVIAACAVPHLDLFLVEAYPTSFYHSPTGFSARSIAEGAQSYDGVCAGCHGAAGQGDGPMAPSLAVPPADLTAAHLWMHSDGELFWWLTHGIDAPEGGLSMPGFAAVLSEDQRWAMIDYIRAHNAALAYQRSGVWPQPLRAPSLQFTCAGRPAELADWRGQYVRLIARAARSAGAARTRLERAAVPGMSAVAAGGCSTDDPSDVAAYAVIAGLPASGLAGSQFLIDGDGWLRAVQRPGTSPGWNDPAILDRRIRSLRTQPRAPPAAAGGAMPMPMPM